MKRLIQYMIYIPMVFAVLLSTSGIHVFNHYCNNQMLSEISFSSSIDCSNNCSHEFVDSSETNTGISCHGNCTEDLQIEDLNSDTTESKNFPWIFHIEDNCCSNSSNVLLIDDQYIPSSNKRNLVKTPNNIISISLISLNSIQIDNEYSSFIGESPPLIHSQNIYRKINCFLC